MTVINNHTQSQFEYMHEGYLAKIEYKIKNDKIFLISTQVPEELSGKGIGSKLASESVTLIESMGLKVVPVCSFLQAWFKKHPEKGYLLAE